MPDFDLNCTGNYEAGYRNGFLQSKESFGKWNDIRLEDTRYEYFRKIHKAIQIISNNNWLTIFPGCLYISCSFRPLFAFLPFSLGISVFFPSLPNIYAFASETYFLFRIKSQKNNCSFWICLTPNNGRNQHLFFKIFQNFKIALKKSFRHVKRCIS